MRRRVVVFVLVLLVVVLRASLPSHVALASDYGVLPIDDEAIEIELAPGATGQAILDRLDEIRRSTTSSRYAHRTDVDPHVGRYHWDCSGMVGWVLRRAAPAAFSAIGGERPLAADFARVIARSPSRPTRSWQRITRIEDVRAGDVFAWRSPEGFRVRNATGHTGFVLAAPRRATAFGNVWLLRVADSTTVPHAADSRLSAVDADGGLGTGTISVVVDGAGAATHYGWLGALSPLYVETAVVFGRPR